MKKKFSSIQRTSLFHKALITEIEGFYMIGKMGKNRLQNFGINRF